MQVAAVARRLTLQRAGRAALAAAAQAAQVLQALPVRLTQAAVAAALAALALEQQAALELSSCLCRLHSTLAPQPAPRLFLLGR